MQRLKAKKAITLALSLIMVLSLYAGIVPASGGNGTAPEVSSDSAPVAASSQSFAVKNEDEPLVPGPNIYEDPDSPTGYTVVFAYDDADATRVRLCGDFMLSNYNSPTSTAIYSPFEFEPGFVRRGGEQFQTDMEIDAETGWWTAEVPLAAGANQYWFLVDSPNNPTPSRWMPDPANMPNFSPGSNPNRDVFNVVYVPYDAEKQGAINSRRVVEIPREDGLTGTWSFVPITIADRERYLGVYLPYGYDAEREEPYKTIYLLHQGGGDESDWLNIGSAPNIMDNLIADGKTEPAVLVTMASGALGNTANGYSGLFDSIIPFVEAGYNVSTEAENRAFAGLSAGGGTTAQLLHYNAAAFGYFGPWSYSRLGQIQGSNSFVVSGDNLDMPVIMMGAGLYEDTRTTAALRYMRQLDRFNAQHAYYPVPGFHDFNTWSQLFRIFAEDILWQPLGGPEVIADPDSPTGYTVKFVYKDNDAASVQFWGDMMLSNYVGAVSNTSAVVPPQEYQSGYVRRGTGSGGGSQYNVEMVKDPDTGWWTTEVPLTAGANQYWFIVDSPRNPTPARWMPDPANFPKVSHGSSATKQSFNAVYVPYDAEKQHPINSLRMVELPRDDGQTGTLDYEPITIGTTQRYLGVYLPYGYDAEREEPYKTIYLLHQGGGDESDWMSIGSVPNIMDNLIAAGRTEPAIVITMPSRALGNAASGYDGLFDSIIPFVEEKYNVSKNAEDRSFSGLSAGGSTTVSLINHDATAFGYFGPWSYPLNLIANAATGDNLDVPVIMLGSGDFEPNPKEGALFYMRRMDNRNAKNYVNYNVAGAHDFNTWSQLFRTFAEDVLWQPQGGPEVIKDPDSPTGYTVRFVYKDNDAASVRFNGDMMLRNWDDRTDTAVYTPDQYQPGLVRGGGAYQADMVKDPDTGWWTIEVPLISGANQYWLFVDSPKNPNPTRWMPDPANYPQFSPGTASNKQSFNAVYVPYDADKQSPGIDAARAVENPRADQKGTLNYVPYMDDTTQRWLGVYLPYGYDADREEPYKVAYLVHGGGQDESDWMTIGSVPKILDNLIADGSVEPMIAVTMRSSGLGSVATNSKLFEQIIPFVEENYNASGNADGRAFAGLSAGGANVASVLVSNPLDIKYLGIWSSSLMGAVRPTETDEYLDAPKIMISVGAYDTVNRHNIARDYCEILEQFGVDYTLVDLPGGHDFNAWNQQFAHFVTEYLWTDSAPTVDAAITTTVSTLVASCAANLPAYVTFAGEAVPFTLGLFGPDGALIDTIEVTESGRYVFGLSAEDTALTGNYIIKAVGANSEKAAVECVPLPTDIWTPVVTEAEGVVTVAFAAEVAFHPTRKSVKIGGAAIDKNKASASGNAITIADVTVAADEQIVIAGVKYPGLFPSYSFTFTVTVPQNNYATLLYQGHGSLRITTREGKVIYIDPYAGTGYDVPADLILVTHGHNDHTAVHLIETQNPGCETITYQEALTEGEYKTFDLGFVTVEAVQAGNNRNHNINVCVGYILTFSDGKSVYVSGDTSTTDQMATFAERNLDYAFFCCDGVYNMGMEEAIACAEMVQAKHSVPYHMAPGSLFNREIAETFLVDGRLIIADGEEILIQ